MEKAKYRIEKQAARILQLKTELSLLKEKISKGYFNVTDEIANKN